MATSPSESARAPTAVFIIGPDETTQILPSKNLFRSKRAGRPFAIVSIIFIIIIGRRRRHDPRRASQSLQLASLGRRAPISWAATGAS